MKKLGKRKNTNRRKGINTLCDRWYPDTYHRGTLTIPINYYPGHLPDGHLPDGHLPSRTHHPGHLPSRTFTITDNKSEYSYYQTTF